MQGSIGRRLWLLCWAGPEAREGRRGKGLKKPSRMFVRARARMLKPLRPPGGLCFRPSRETFGQIQSVQVIRHANTKSFAEPNRRDLTGPSRYRDWDGSLDGAGLAEQ